MLVAGAQGWFDVCHESCVQLKPETLSRSGCSRVQRRGRLGHPMHLISLHVCVLYCRSNSWLTQAPGDNPLRCACVPEKCAQ